MDPSHVAFSHHGILGKRQGPSFLELGAFLICYAATPVPALCVQKKRLLCRGKRLKGFEKICFQSKKDRSKPSACLMQGCSGRGAL